MRISNLSKSEREIMSILWAAGRPLSSREIVDLAENRTWRSNSIHMFLNNLLDKEAIRIADVALLGKHASRTFEPIYSESESIANEIRAMTGFQRDPVKTIAAVLDSLMQHMELAEGQREELCAILKREN